MKSKLDLGIDTFWTKYPTMDSRQGLSNRDLEASSTYITTNIEYKLLLTVTSMLGQVLTIPA